VSTYLRTITYWRLTEVVSVVITMDLQLQHRVVS